MFLAPIYTARERICSLRGGIVSAFDATVRGTDAAQSVGDRYLVAPVSAFVAWLGRQVQKIEAGNFRVYILYIVAALIFFLCLAVWMQ